MIARAPFGRLPDGRLVERITLATGRGHAAELLTLGGILRSLRVPDRHGRPVEVALGCDGVGDYLAQTAYMGAIVGRVAARVRDARLEIDGVVWELPRNDGAAHLHGGPASIEGRLWSVDTEDRGADGGRATFRIVSPDGDNGHPGTLAIAASYTLGADGVFEFRTECTSDRRTAASLTQHAYFNLGGPSEPDIRRHEARIHADAFALVDEALVTTGRSESGAPLPGGLREWRRLADVLPLLPAAHGDLYFLHPLARPRPDRPTLAAEVRHPETGIRLEVFTDEACLQFYTGSHLDGRTTGSDGRRHGPHAGFCLECHGHPDATRRPEWGPILVEPGRPQVRRTRYVFSA